MPLLILLIIIAIYYLLWGKMETVPGRPKYFYFWPTFNTEKDARDIAIVATMCLAISAAYNAFSTYWKGGEDAAIAALIIILVFGTLGYFTFKLNRVMSTLSFLVFIADKVYTIIKTVQVGKSPVVSLIFLLFIFHAVRAAFWYHGKRKTLRSE